VIDRIADALNEIPGPVLVVGHSDSQPIRSFRYQNNFELSAARADAVVQRLASKLHVAGRVQSNGVGSTQPKYLPPDTAREPRAQSARGDRPRCDRRQRQMKKLILNRWTLSMLGLLLLLAVVWVLGPYFAFGEARPMLSMTGRRDRNADHRARLARRDAVAHLSRNAGQPQARKRRWPVKPTRRSSQTCILRNRPTRRS
jgi:hypothetical protein